SVQAYLYDDQLAVQSAAVYSTGSFIEITSQRIKYWYYTNNLGNGIFLVMTLLPMFLFGAFIAKSKWFEKSHEHLKKIKIILGISLVIGVPVKLLPVITSKNVATEYLQDSIGGPAIAIVYATSIILLMRHTIWRKVMSPIA